MTITHTPDPLHVLSDDDYHDLLDRIQECERLIAECQAELAMKVSVVEAQRGTILELQQAMRVAS